MRHPPPSPLRGGPFPSPLSEKRKGNPVYKSVECNNLKAEVETSVISVLTGVSIILAFVGLVLYYVGSNWGFSTDFRARPGISSGLHPTGITNATGVFDSKVPAGRVCWKSIETTLPADKLISVALSSLM